MSLMRIDAALKEAKKMLENVADRPLFEAQILLAHFLGRDRVFLHAHPEERIDADGYFELVKRRANFEPIEYITKKVSFYGKEFFVEPGVLIPRPETEILVDEVSKRLKGEEIVAEIGVGSGIISIMLKLKFPNLRIIATDINPKALQLTKKNAKRFGVSIELHQTSYLDGIAEPIDVIVSNPPYIKNEATLEKPLSFEPKEALFGGERGDEVLREIIDRFFTMDAKILACEMGYDQKSSIHEYLQAKKEPFLIDFYKDLAGLDRGFVIQKDRV